MTTEAQTRAISEALGWLYREGVFKFYGDDGIDVVTELWTHGTHDSESQTPRLDDDTTLGRAMCYDAIVWLHDKGWTIEREGEAREPFWRIAHCEFEHFDCEAPSLPAALEAAMIEELGI